jgi:hypothetical protein
MEFSPRRSWLHRKLYRNGMLAVTLATSTWLASSWVTSSWAAAQGLTPQYGRKPASNKGPRALGLVQLSPKGKARFIPIAIMIDGKFYDAGSYKAAPVPMALDFGIVYEGFRSGVSQGEFTITQPGQLNHVWIAEGRWLPAGAIDPNKRKKYSAPVIADDDKDGPPVLHRRGEKSAPDAGSDGKDKGKNQDQDKDAKDKDQPKPATTTASSPPPTGAPTASSPTPTSDTAKAPAANAPAPAETAKAPAAASTSASDSAADEPIGDPNRPRLRRGKPESTAHLEPFTTFDPLMDAKPGAASATGKPGATTKDSPAPTPQIVLIPAISDVGGPDPRPYTYDVKPAEEAVYRNKMLDLASTQLGAQARGPAKEGAPTSKKAPATKSAGKSASKLPKLDFDDVSLRIFDLSNSNEPVLVLSAKTHPPATNNGEGTNADEPKEITLIARTNLEGELRKLFFSQTDSRHLDVAPRMELVDAVDADGDGRGELLFRRTFDDGSAYAIYRVTADGLWPLFEGTP